MKITLQVNGREMTLSEEELIAILEKHFSDKTNKTEVQTTKGVQTEDKTTQAAKKRATGKRFDVIPKLIDRSLFQEKREDLQQEWTREIILEAFDVVDRHPEKYAKSFTVMIPKKTWESKTVGELKSLAKKMGDHIANWVEWALSLAQRISNGETWEAICNDPDTEEWYRLIVWKNGCCRLVGGSVNYSYFILAWVVGFGDCFDCDSLNNSVPLVVL